MQVRIIVFLFSFFLLGKIHVAAQFTPVPVTGFSQDVIAEGAPNSLANTTMELDAIGSNKVMYSVAFAAFAGITAGLPDNGTIISGGDTYQLAPYTSNNALFVKRNEAFDFNITTPASFAKLRILCFSTEGPSTVNISLSFTDGTTTPYITNYVLADWFFGVGNIVSQGFGRCSRIAAGPFTPDGLPTNPRMYYIEVTLNCTDIPKSLQKISFANVSTSGAVPFPNAVFLGVSGLPYSQTIADFITPSDCSGSNGSIALTVSGSSSPYSYSWNTAPVQTSSTATGLAPGTYTCTITNAAGCTSTYTGVVPLNNNAAITATANPTAICPGAPVQLTANVTAGPLTTFTWNPGALTGSSVSVSPITTTIYTVSASNAIGCTASAQVTVTVNLVPAAPIVNNITICTGNTATLLVQAPQPGYSYNWYDAATGGILLATGNSYTTAVLTSNTTYYVQAVNTTNCSSAIRTAVTVIVTNLPAAPVVNGITVCSGTTATLSVNNPQAGFTYNWYTVATGGTALASGVSFTANNITTNATYFVEAVNGGGCISATRTAVTISLLPQLPQPVITLTNTTFTSLTFSWTAVPGATGYQVTTNGGATFQLPSSGMLGTTHTISGLTGNTTVIIQVRVLGVQSCETSLLSAPASGTTFSSKEIFVPNVFTPNGDGKNDVLLVYGNYVSSIQFRIFNQWGQLIFISRNINTGWDGTFSGQQQPVGVYAFTLQVILQDGTIINKKGSINLIR